MDFVGMASDATGPNADGVLYQAGDFDFYGAEEFYLDFVRQFEVTDEDGEHDHFEQLHCEFRFPMTEATRSFGRFNAWWFVSSREPWVSFAARVEARPEFIALKTAPPTAAKVEQEVV